MQGKFVLTVDFRGVARKMDVFACFLFFKSRTKICNKVAMSRRFGEISRLGNVKKNENDK